MPKLFLVRSRASEQKQPRASGNTKPKPSEYLPPFEPEELGRIVRMFLSNYDSNIQKEAAHEFVSWQTEMTA